MFECIFFNGEKLPEALSEEENIYYCRRYKMGDMSARNIIINHNLRLVSFVIIKKFGKVSYNLEDLMSIGIEGLIKGIDKYDESRGNKLSSYYSKCVIYEILHFFENENKYKDKIIEMISIDDVAIYGNGYVVLNQDIIDDFSESLEDMVIDKMMDEYYMEIVYNMLFKLSDRDRKIFMLSYGFVDGVCYKQEEIAKIVGVSRGVVSMVLSRGLKKMRERLLFQENKSYCRKK